jgi:hypothetical protein
MNVGGAGGPPPPPPGSEGGALALPDAYDASRIGVRWDRNSSAQARQE